MAPPGTRATIPGMPPRHRRPGIARMLGAPLALGLALAACAPATSPSPSPSATPTTTAPPVRESPSPSGPAATSDAGAEAIYQAIEEAVVDLRGLEPKQEVEPQLLDEEEVKERTEASFREDNPEEFIEANEILYRALGMIDGDDDLAELYIELLGSQVAGYYDPEVDELFVVARTGEVGVTERVTYAHEYTHALQDQHFDLSDFGLDEIGHGDRNAARLSLVEGDATTVMAFWAQSVLTPEEALELLESSQDPESLAILNRMPPILRESLTFPYEQGLQFVLRLQSGGGWDAIDAAYDDPPASTEQVLHPEKYEDREDPIEVELPADLATQLGEGWSATYEDTFGEFQFQVWLRNAIDRATGNPAAEGWGGDRFAVLQGPDDAWAVVMSTTWDSADDASEFGEAAGTVVGDGELPGTVLADGRDVTIVVASDGRTLNEAVSAAGFVVSG
jgi:hypothetical protein